MIWISISIISITIVGVSLGRFPFLRMNRATIAFVGAVALILSGAISIEEAYRTIDLNTIALLLSIMILNVNFKLSGFFSLISVYILRIAKTPRRLLGLLIFFAGILSALFLNDTIVLVFTPIVLDIASGLKRNSVPYLIALATAANIGSVATIIGNPQNILIGSFSGIKFVEFTAYLFPVACVGLIFIWLLIITLYQKEFSKEPFELILSTKNRIHRPLMRKSVFSALLMLAAMIFGVPTAIAAMGAASLLLVTRRLKAERVFTEIDWSLLVFFSGLFVVTGSIRTLGLSEWIFKLLFIHSGNDLIDLTIISTLASNIISNVPAVLLLKDIVASFSNTKIIWLLLAMATTFAGNLTLLGSVANLIVAETAKKRGIYLSFSEYLRSGILITLGTLIIGTLWLSIFYR
ncbi:anion transporter [candidate division KSB1 bacterium]|nr:anion transporter [candidate division KSB1 bacterium]